MVTGEVLHTENHRFPKELGRKMVRRKLWCGGNTLRDHVFISEHKNACQDCCVTSHADRVPPTIHSNKSHHTLLSKILW